MIETSTSIAVHANHHVAPLASIVGPVEVSYQSAAGEDIEIIDLRDFDDYRKGHVPGALNLPKGEWESIKTLRKGAVTIVYGYNPACELAAQVCDRMLIEGFRVMEMDGGFAGWRKNGLPIEK